MDKAPATATDRTAHKQSSARHAHRAPLRNIAAGSSKHHHIKSTRPRGGGPAASPNIIRNTNSSVQNHQRPRLDTSISALVQSNVTQLPPKPMFLVATGSPSSTARSPDSVLNLPPLRDIFGTQLPPLLIHPGGEISDLALWTPPQSYRRQSSPSMSARSPHQGPHSAGSPQTHFNTMHSLHAKPLSPQSDATLMSVLPHTQWKSLGGPLSADSVQVDSVRSGLPPLPDQLNVNKPSEVLRCKHDGCNMRFQTKYLLNSHMNVHSFSRPHHCPEKDCSRGEGQKGFKRKNEMIRHGLVHKSPGYACPFCPDREHKYPRPDNLQRHVKVHHTDKDKDDPVLRKVLDQRNGGESRGRRRRINGSTFSRGGEVNTRVG